MSAPEKSGHDRRRFGRIRSRDVVTRLGEVLDLSAAGMRIKCELEHAPADGAIMLLELRHPQGCVEVKSRVVRLTPCDDGQMEVGFAFEDVSPTTSAGLLHIARLAMQAIAVDYLHEQQH